jgi:Xaa-Pro aminopeptidase
MYPHQIERLDAAVARLGAAALVGASPANVAYLTGFHSGWRAAYPDTEVYAVYAGGRSALVVPAIESPAAVGAETSVDHVVCYGTADLVLAAAADPAARRAAALAAKAASSAAEALAAALAALGVTTGAVGLDDAGLGPAPARAIAAALARLTLAPATDALAEARLVKAPYEIECLQQALHIAEESVAEVIDELKAGVTERQAAARYEAALARRRAQPWATRIAFGANAAVPSAAPGDRALRAGELIRLDVACVFKGYHGAIARTAVLGEPSARQQALHDAVDAGVGAATDAIQPGAAPEVVRAAAITAVQEAGLADFGAGHVGHGVGLEVRELPRLGPGGPPLEAGMVLRIELARSELGEAGVHVSETVLVTRAGAAVMNRANRGLVVLD